MESDDMDMGGMTTSMGGMGGMGDMACMKHQMWTYFHVKPDDTILFDFWGVSNAGEMVWSSFIIFGLALIPEFIKFMRWKMEQRQKMDGIPYVRRLFMPSHLLQTFLFGVQLFFSYILMLCFMTFNVWLCIAVVTGVSMDPTMDMGGTATTMDMGGSTMTPMHMGPMMMMCFHFRIEEPILFKQWIPHSMVAYVFSCIAVGALAFAYEVTKFGRTVIDKDLSVHGCCDAQMQMSESSEGSFTKLPFAKDNLTGLWHAISCIIYFIQTFGSYCLMMISMTYNVPICLSMLAGHILAFFFLGPLTTSQQRDESGDCCG